MYIHELSASALTDAALFAIERQMNDNQWHTYKLSGSDLKSALTLAGFITTTSDTLVYYYTKSQTYSKTEVNALIESVKNSRFEKVETLPVTGESNVIYLVPRSEEEPNNVYDEYIWLDEAWEKIGSTDIDLSGYVTTQALNTILADYMTTSAFNTAIANYYTKTEINSQMDSKVDKVTGKGLSTNDYTNTEKDKLAGISTGATKTESSETNGNIKIDGVEKTVYDDSEIKQDLTTAQNTANTALAYAQNKVYGMRIRESIESNPASIISYLADAVGMTPVHMDYTNNVFDYGSWEDAWFIKDCKPCILGQDGVVQAYLNKNDYTKDIYGNTVTIDENLTGANVMIEFPKIWYKIVPVVPTCCDADVFISPVKLDDDYKDFAYIAQDKTHKEHFYMPAYNGSIINDGTNDVLRSLSGQAVGNSKTGTEEITLAQRNGTGWYTETFSQVTLINLLLMLIGKSTDTQTVFGRGIDTGSQTAFNAYRTGAGNTNGMFWGSNNGTQLVKVFGIENWWSLQWRRFGGLMCVNGTFKYKMCWGQEDGSTTDNYNTDASGYIKSPSPAPSGTSGGYISRMFFTTVNMLMSVVSGSSSTKYCDGGWFNNSATTYAVRGGGSYSGAVCGVFALDVSRAVSSAYWDRGAALSYT